MTHRRIFLRLLVFVITFLTFARLTTCEFTWWDDQETIHQNPRLNPPKWSTLGYYWMNAGEHETMGLYVPVTYTVWTGLAHIARLNQPDAQGITLDAAYFHTANVLLHSITGVIVFELLWRIFGSDLGAFLGALIFSLHPVQVESVGWVSGTKDLLYGLLGVSALLMYVRSVQIKSEKPQPRLAWRWRYWASVVLFALAMLSKPTAVVLPLMAVVVGVLLLGRPARQTLISLLPWFVLMIPCIIWTQKVQPPTWVSPLPIWDRPAVAADAVGFYLCKLVWPMRLCIDYGRNPQFIAANHAIYYTWVLPGLVAVFLFWRFNRLRPVAAGALLFLMPLLPVLGFVPFEFQMISTTSDHYLYLAMLGVAVMVCWWLSGRHAQLAMWGVIVVLILFGIRSLLQEPVWQNSQTLFTHALAVNPLSTPSLDGLGFLTGRDARELLKQGKRADARVKFDESIAFYKKSVEINPASVPSMANLALDYQKIDREDLGRELLHRIVAMQPTLAPGLRAEPLTIAHLLLDFDDIPGAISWLDQMIERDPTNLQAQVLRERAIQHLNSTSRPVAR